MVHICFLSLVFYRCHRELLLITTLNGYLQNEKDGKKEKKKTLCETELRRKECKIFLIVTLYHYICSWSFLLSCIVKFFF